VTRGEGQIQDLRFKRKAAIMPIIHEEIIEDIEAHIRKSHGACNDWWVGTAKDARAPFFRRHLATDLGDGLIYREAYTTVAAQAVVDHLVNNRGLQLDQDAMQEAELGSEKGVRYLFSCLCIVRNDGVECRNGQS